MSNNFKLKKELFRCTRARVNYVKFLSFFLQHYTTAGIIYPDTCWLDVQLNQTLTKANMTDSGIVFKSLDIYI